jgi:hypothetical protein
MGNQGGKDEAGYIRETKGELKSNDQHHKLEQRYEVFIQT